MKIWLVLMFALSAHSKAIASNNGLFADIDLGSSARCYSIRHGVQTGLSRYATAETYLSAEDKADADAYPPAKPAILTWYQKAFGGLVDSYAADHICVGRDVVVSKPIYTNGGNIIIVADTLRVAKSIDTRIYFDLGDPTRHTRIDLSRGPAFIQQQADYYTRNEDAVKLGAAVFAPEFPSGGTLRLSDGVGGATDAARNGSPAPVLSDTERRQMTSGSITIFARKYVIGPELQAGRQQSSNICPNESLAAKPFAFQAGGIRGGKGGMGSPPGCFYHAGGPFGCVDKITVNSGFTGPPGPGGDAGNVRLVKLDGTFTPSEERALLQASNVEGGPSGNIANFRTFTLPEVDAGAAIDICQRPLAGQHATASTGAGGIVAVGTANALQALSEVDSFASQHDGLPSGDLSDLIKRARTNEALSYASFTEFLRSTLARTALHAEQEVAYDLANYLETNKLPLTTADISPFKGISKASPDQYLSLSTRVSGLAQRLGSLDSTVGKNHAFYKYFLGKGGAFNITSPDTINNLLTKGLSEDLAQVILSSDQQLIALLGIERTVAEGLFIIKRDEMLAAISAIESRIKDIERIIEERPGEFERLNHAIKDAGPAISAMVGAIASQNYLLAAQQIGPLVKGLSAAYQELYGMPTDLTPAIGRLRLALSGLRDDFGLLVSAFNQEKSIQLQRQEYAGIQELKSRQRLASRLDGRLPYGEDLIKLSLVTFISDPSKNKTILRENLREIGYLLEGRTDTTSMLRLKQLESVCSGNLLDDMNSGRCLVIEPTSRYRAFVGKFAGLELPAYVVAPSKIRYVVPTLGMSLKNVVISDDLTNRVLKNLDAKPNMTFLRLQERATTTRDSGLR